MSMLSLFLERATATAAAGPPISRPPTAFQNAWSGRSIPRPRRLVWASVQLITVAP